jgi:chemotaxis family two-component system sensor kinase Cph1
MKMNHSAERMQVLIKDILKYTKVKDDHEAFETVDMNELIQEVVGELKETLLEKKAEIQIHQLPVIRGIPFLLRQLFSNLIYNSLKFSDVSRNPIIDISASQTFLKINSSGNTAPFHTIRFADNGIGFDKKYSDLIFKIFSRLNTREEYQGSGIGLALCKKIMDKHAGIISAEGQENLGATFFLHFPLQYGS